MPSLFRRAALAAAVVALAACERMPLEPPGIAYGPDALPSEVTVDANAGADPVQSVDEAISDSTGSRDDRP